MNWRLECDAKDISKADITVDLAESEEAKKPKPQPNADLVKAVRSAGKEIADTLGSKDVHFEANVHETTEGRGFRPGHVSFTISKLDPKR